MTSELTGTVRIDKRFKELASANRAALVTYIMAGDPNLDVTSNILRGLPAAGADIIELGLPFTDPMADGPEIQLSAQRALKAGTSVRHILEMVCNFRKHDSDTPIVLMGYYNPVYTFGPELFVAAAKDAGVDGLIIVDLPPEEDPELCLPALQSGLSFIRLATPTTDTYRLSEVLKNTSGFIYYVSINGITGSASPDLLAVSNAVERVKLRTKLPISVGFGIKTPEQAAAVSRIADGVVVGSALVATIAKYLDRNSAQYSGLVEALLSQVEGFADGVRMAREKSF